MTHSIEEGLGQLFALIVPLSQEFSKRTYTENFRRKYAEFQPLFEEIAAYCESSEDTDAAVSEIAGVIPDAMKALLEKEGSKRRKENLLMKYNLGMVAFIIPMLRYGRRPVFESVSEQMVALWNDNGVGMNIENSTYEDIESGFKSHLCYITTAVCKSLGKPDNCYELTLLRDYRDGYLAGQEGGAGIIKEYYNIAPTIVKRIDRMENSAELYQQIWERYLKPCVSLIEEERREECRKVYTDMVHSLQKEYLYS